MKKLALVLALLVVFASMPSYADMLRERTEIIRSADQSFIIDVGGSLDHDNIEIAIENTGSLPAVNPRVTVNGRYNWYTLDGLAAEITAGCRTEEERAWAIFQFVCRESYWWPHPKDLTAMNHVRHFNSYGYHICSMAAAHFTAVLHPIPPSKELIARLEPHEDIVMNVAFSPVPGQLMLASGGLDNMIKMTEILTQQPLSEPLGDGQEVAIAIGAKEDGTIQIARQSAAGLNVVEMTSGSDRRRPSCSASPDPLPVLPSARMASSLHWAIRMET